MTSKITQTMFGGHVLPPTAANAANSVQNQQSAVPQPATLPAHSSTPEGTPLNAAPEGQSSDATAAKLSPIAQANINENSGANSKQEFDIKNRIAAQPQAIVAAKKEDEAQQSELAQASVDNLLLKVTNVQQWSAGVFVRFESTRNLTFFHTFATTLQGKVDGIKVLVDKSQTTLACQLPELNKETIAEECQVKKIPTPAEIVQIHEKIAQSAKNLLIKCNATNQSNTKSNIAEAGDQANSKCPEMVQIEHAMVEICNGLPEPGKTLSKTKEENVKDLTRIAAVNNLLSEIFKVLQEQSNSIKAYAFMKSYEAGVTGRNAANCSFKNAEDERNKALDSAKTHLVMMIENLKATIYLLGQVHNYESVKDSAGIPSQVLLGHAKVLLQKATSAHQNMLLVYKDFIVRQDAIYKVAKEQGSGEKLRHIVITVANDGTSVIMGSPNGKSQPIGSQTASIAASRTIVQTTK